MIIAGYAAVFVGVGNADLATVIVIGVIVALGATIAKGIHYGITFFIGKRIGEHKHKKFEANTTMIKKWAFIMLFLAAATPIPDEPITVTLGLMKYSVTKFFTAFFLGKLSIAIIGAFLGNMINNTISTWFNIDQGEMNILMAIMSTMLTVIIVVIMVKVDLSKITKVFRRKKPIQDDLETLGKIGSVPI